MGTARRYVRRLFVAKLTPSEMRTPPMRDGMPARTARERARCPACLRVVRVTKARTFERHDVSAARAREVREGRPRASVQCGASRQPLSLEAEPGDSWAT